MILSREAELVDEAEAGFSGSDGAGCCPRAASIDLFTKRSNAALTSAMTLGRGGCAGGRASSRTQTK
jgi:hypothetical protein